LSAVKDGIEVVVSAMTRRIRTCQRCKSRGVQLL
jgi:hypothetical protein